MDTNSIAGSLMVKSIPINWHDGFPIYASEPFLRSVADLYGWIGGVDETGKVRCILPYTVIRKAGIRMVRFRVETIPFGEDLDIRDEKSFLNGVVQYCRSIGADMIIPATTNTVFRTYPDGAIAAPYSSYVILLSQTEEELWSNISHKYRKEIRSAMNKGVTVKSGMQYLDIAHAIVRNTFKRSGHPFMGYDEFKRMIDGLGDHARVAISFYQGEPQSCTVYHFSAYSAYAVHGGSIPKPLSGAMKLLQWESIRFFRNLGVKKFDLVGARVNPEKGSKQEGIMLFKQYLGGKPVQGYIWKYPISSLKYAIYSQAVRLQRGGDIVDLERHKLVKDDVGEANL
jgi:hypothetical protein